MPDPYTSEWWLDTLGKQLDERERVMDQYERYYNGIQPLLLASDKFRQTFGTTYARFSDNFCRLVVQAVEERLTVDGFRWNDDAGSKKAWRIWQSNKLDAISQRGHREALIKSDCPVIVGPSPTGGLPIIRPQEPEHVVIAYGDDPHERVCAMKRWKTATGKVLATLYFPDRLEKYEQVASSTSGEAWQPRAVEGEPWPLPHDLGVVPVVALINDPDLDNTGASELTSVIPLQNALNKLLVDMLVSAEYTAYRQRWVTGMEIPIDEDTGKPVEPFKAAVDRLWVARDPGTKFGDFDQTDLAPYAQAIELLIQHIASTTRTPPHYLLGQSGSFPSGESLKSTETGLVAKAHRRMRDFGETWEEVMRIAFRASGDAKRSEHESGETIWRDPEYRTEGEHIDALLKLSALDVPKQQLWEDAGYSPQQIERFAALRAADAHAAGSTADAHAAGGDEDLMKRIEELFGAHRQEMAAHQPAMDNSPDGPLAMQR